MLDDLNDTSSGEDALGRSVELFETLNDITELHILRITSLFTTHSPQLVLKLF